MNAPAAASRSKLKDLQHSRSNRPSEDLVQRPKPSVGRRKRTVAPLELHPRWQPGPPLCASFRIHSSKMPDP